MELAAEHGQTTLWKISDISLKGLQVEDGDPSLFSLGAPVTYQIRLLVKDGEVVIRGEGQVVWKSEAGRMGVKFWEIDDLSLGHLRRLMELNLGNAETVEQELSVFPARDRESKRLSDGR